MNLVAEMWMHSWGSRGRRFKSGRPDWSEACGSDTDHPCIKRYASEVPDCDLVICPQSVTIAFRVPKSRDAAHLWVTTQQCAVTTGSLDGWPGRWLPPLPRAISRNRQGPRHPEQAVAPDGWPLRAPAPAGLEAAPPCQASGPGAAAVAAGNEVESRALASALCRSVLLTCARLHLQEHGHEPSGGDVDAFLGVKGSPVQIRPSRLVTEFF